MKTIRRLLADVGVVGGAIALTVLLLMIGLYAAGYPAHLVMAQWVRGAMGTKYYLFVSLKNTTPLLLTGLAAGVAFRSGVFNIGAEGQSILGGIATAVIATRLFPHVSSGLVGIPLALVAAIFAGAAWAGIASLLERYRAVPIVLSTILLNFVSLQLLGMLVGSEPRGFLKAGDTAMIQSDPMPAAYVLPLLAQVGELHVGLLIALAAAAIAWIIQSRTTFGFELEAVGLNPVAARLSGMPVQSRQIWVMLLSGAYAGLAGSIQVLGVSHVLGESSPGYGYTGIAIALLGRLHPAGIVLAALFFSLLDQGASTLEDYNYPLPHEVADIVKGLIVILLLIAASQLARRRYQKEQA
jgi:simple sugar transport system permease protein